MAFEEYEAAAARTDSGELADSRDATYHVLKIAGEAGEIANFVGKVRGQGHKYSVPKMMEEMGDVLWHLSRLAARLEVSLEDVAQMNIDKLRRRYPEGFKVAASVNRKDD